MLASLKLASLKLASLKMESLMMASRKTSFLRTLHQLADSAFGSHAILPSAPARSLSYNSYNCHPAYLIQTSPGANGWQRVRSFTEVACANRSKETVVIPIYVVKGILRWFMSGFLSTATQTFFFSSRSFTSITSTLSSKDECF